LTELIEVSNPNGCETVYLRSVFDAELYLLIVSAEFDREKPQPNKRLTPGGAFQKKLGSEDCVGEGVILCFINPLTSSPAHP
jgi:hypothetical protein